MVIEKNRVAAIDYVLKGSDGEIIDASEGGTPLEYLHGNSNLIPGLERELEGKKAGDAVKAVIAAKDAYGERDNELIMQFPKTAFEGTEKLEPGMQFEAAGENGYQVFTIMKVEGDNVTVDGNHPLAGETLNFDVKIVSVREATAEEIENGHLHGSGGCGCGCGCGDGDCGDECGEECGCEKEDGCGCH